MSKTSEIIQARFPIRPIARIGRLRCPVFRVRCGGRLSKLAPLVLILCGIFASAAAAQGASPPSLDDARFIRGLRERGMKELLLYYLQQHPADDPLDEWRFLIERNKLQVEDASLPPGRRAEAADQALAAYRGLLETAGDGNPKRPIWETDFVSYIARVILPVRHNHAARFVAFGVPTAEQRAAYERLVPESLRIIERAAKGMADPGAPPLTGDPAATTEEDATFWNDLRADYRRVQQPYYRAWAHLHARFLDGPSGRPADALRWINGVLDESMPAAARPRLLTLRGRILLRLGRLDQAVRTLRRVAAMSEARPDDVLDARLALSKALDRQEKTEAALAILREARGMEWIHSNPMLLVLTFDREFQITGDYAAYDRLLAHPDAQEQKRAIEAFVNRRFADQPLPSGGLAEAAPRIVLAKAGKMIRQAVERRKETERGNGDPTGPRAPEADRLLTRARDALRELLDRRDLSPSRGAAALFKLGLSDYHLNHSFDAAQTWVRLADRYSDQAIAQSGATNGFTLARTLYGANPSDRRAVELYDRAQRVLLEKYPSASMSGGEPARLHWHTRGGFLREQGRYADAVAAFEHVGPDHPLYADALYQRAVAAYERWLRAPAGAGRQRARAFVEAANAGLEALARAGGGGGGENGEGGDERARTRRYQRGDLTLRRAEVWAESSDQEKRAGDSLEGFEKRYRSFHDLVSGARRLRVNIDLRTGRLEAARDEVRRFVEENPERGGAMIQKVLDAVNRQVRTRRAAGSGEKAEDLAAAGVDLARFLSDWAAKQPDLADDPERLLAYRVLLARQLLIAERYEPAAALFNELAAAPGGKNNLRVLHGRAKAYFELGRFEQALPLINRLLNQAPDQNAPAVWDAWRMRLSILDARRRRARKAGDPKKADELSHTIYTTVRKLELYKENLGGSRYAPALNRLKNENAPQ